MPSSTDFERAMNALAAENIALKSDIERLQDGYKIVQHHRDSLRTLANDYRKSTELFEVRLTNIAAIVDSWDHDAYSRDSTLGSFEALEAIKKLLD